MKANEGSYRINSHISIRKKRKLHFPHWREGPSEEQAIWPITKEKRFLDSFSKDEHYSSTEQNSKTFEKELSLELEGPWQSLW